MTHRSRLSRDPWQYTVTPWDAYYEDIGARYGVSYVELAEENRGVLPATEATHHPAEAGLVIGVPVPEELFDYEWEAYDVAAGQTLADVCEVRNATAARGDEMTTSSEEVGTLGLVRTARAPHLTPEYLWGLLLNCDFRRQYFEEHATADGTSFEVAPDALPTLTLAGAGVLWIPWAPRAIGRSVLVAPSTAARDRGDFGPSFAPDMCTTCESVPNWVDELYVDFLVPMTERTELLRDDNRSYRDIVNTYMTELGHLHVIDLLIGVMAEQPHARPVTGLRDRLEALHGSFADWMRRYTQADVEFILAGAVATRRQRRGRYLLDKLESARFNELVFRAFNELEYIVNERESVRTRICGVVLDACTQVMRIASLEEEVAERVDHALAANAVSVPDRVAPVGGRDALDTLLSLGGSNIGLPDRPVIGTTELFDIATYAARVGTTLVGNLPGPPALAGALLSLGLTRDLRAMSPALNGGGIGPLTAAHTARLSELGAYSQIPEEELRAALGAVTSQEEVERIAGRISGRFQSSGSWCSALAIIGLIGAMQAGLNPPADPLSLASSGTWAVWVSNLASSSVSAFSGMVGMIVRFGDETGAAEALCTGLGRLSVGLMVLAGALQGAIALWRGDHVGAALGFGTAIGGVLILFSGWCAVIGAIIITATTIASVVLDATEGSPDTRRTVKSLLTSLRRQTRVHRVLVEDGPVDLQLSAFERYVDESEEFTAVVEWLVGPYDGPPPANAARDTLRALGISESIINAFVTIEARSALVGP